jgi:four helix bundle protein
MVPSEEKYSLTDQVRRSSRSVCANIAEAFRKRRYPKSFVSKLSDSEGEAAETQVWLDFAVEFEYINIEKYNLLYDKYDHILSQLILMINSPEKWRSFIRAFVHSCVRAFVPSGPRVFVLSCVVVNAGWRNT